MFLQKLYPVPFDRHYMKWTSNKILLTLTFRVWRVFKKIPPVLDRSVKTKRWQTLSLFQVRQFCSKFDNGPVHGHKRWSILDWTLEEKNEWLEYLKKMFHLRPCSCKLTIFWDESFKVNPLVPKKCLRVKKLFIFYLSFKIGTFCLIIFILIHGYAHFRD